MRTIPNPNLNEKQCDFVFYCYFMIRIVDGGSWSASGENYDWMLVFRYFLLLSLFLPTSVISLFSSRILNNSSYTPWYLSTSVFIYDSKDTQLLELVEYFQINWAIIKHKKKWKACVFRWSAIQHSIILLRSDSSVVCSHQFMYFE